DNAVPANSSSYLVLDTEARNVGAYDPQVSYTPGRAIPAAGLIQFNGQTWQAIPEPATLGLLGLGTLVMALRRKPGK
ncbi:MAG TPA: PEP-CTERM sorting domain-containing protein, partial [Kiritimatiellia bacterium]|nr:PEP-CTERM sorting domain-containing protein [Kiritimatiellia bacterium]